MKVSGFTFVRNAVKYDYPVVESIRSILPVVDEFIVNVERCDDGTRELIRSIGGPKLKIVESVWDETLRKDGLIYAQQTNIITGVRTVRFPERCSTGSSGPAS